MGLFVRISPEEKAASILRDAIQKRTEAEREMSEAEIRSRNRVNITVEEYDRLRQELETLKCDNRLMRYLLTCIGIPEHVLRKIKTDTVKVETSEDLRWFRRYYRVTFAVDREDEL